MKQTFFVTLLALIFSFPAFAQNQISFCPKVEVTGGGVVSAGEPMNFTVNLTGSTNIASLEYEWKVSAGTIASGQKTASITVDTTELNGGINITAEVKIKGLSNMCVNTASETGSIMQRIGCGRPLDEFGSLSSNEIKARIQSLYVELGNNPEGQGYIINYGTDEEIANRERQIQKAIRFLKLDANHVTIVRGGENPNGAGVWTRIWIIPPGAEFPIP
jgi:PKD-like domain